MKEITGFHHLGIMVVDREAAIDFYEKALGFKLLYRFDDENIGHLAMLERDGFQLEVLQMHQGYDNPKECALATGNHFGLTVDDVEVAAQKIIDYGIPLELEIFGVTDFGGKDLRACFFRGPNGEFIELLQVMN